jgi:hypothetical protein
MAQVTVKYKCGDKVRTKHKNPTEGVVTAIFLRGRGRAYEFSYTGENGPDSRICQECELESCKKDNKKFGF